MKAQIIGGEFVWNIIWEKDCFAFICRVLKCLYLMDKAPLEQVGIGLDATYKPMERGGGSFWGGRPRPMTIKRNRWNRRKVMQLGMGCSILLRRVTVVMESTWAYNMSWGGMGMGTCHIGWTFIHSRRWGAMSLLDWHGIPSTVTRARDPYIWIGSI